MPHDFAQTRAGSHKGPQIYGPYLLLDLIGRGGMAEVFRAVRRGPEGFLRTIALKRVIPEYARAPEFVEMFCAEARLSALLDHPNIVQVYDFGEAEGTHHLTMELLKGRNVLSVRRSLRARGVPCPIEAAAQIGRQVALALAYAHELRNGDGVPLHVVHRDVTPSNIMLLRTGGVKLLDFGVAKAPSLSRAQTQAGCIKGKIPYSSPEQLRCRPLDGRSDVFSLGVTIWELLAGARLFRGDSDLDTMNNVVGKRVPPLSELRGDVPPLLEEAVLAALERAPERRPTSRELAGALGEVLHGLPGAEGAVSELTRDLFGEATSRTSLLLSEREREPHRPPAAVRRAQPTALAAGRGARRPAPLAARSARPVVLETRATPTGPLPRAIEIRPERPPRLPVVALGAVGLALVALLGWPALRDLGSWLLPAAVPPPRLSASGASALVTLELDSQPPDAVVQRDDGAALGRTPLQLQLRRGSAPIVFTVQKRGFRPARYEVVPDRDSIATLELEPLAAP